MVYGIFVDCSQGKHYYRKHMTLIGHLFDMKQFKE